MLQVPSTYARVNTLGQPLKVYKGGFLQPLSFIGLGIILLISAGVAFFASFSWGPAAAAVGYDLGLYGKIAPLGLVLIAALCFLRAISVWGKAVVVYERGVAFKNRRGVQAWRWEDIQSIYAAVTRTLYMGIIPTSTARLYTVTSYGNDIFTFDQTLSRSQDLAEDIRRAIHPIQLARSLQVYESGQMAAFGTLGVSRQGVSYGGKTYPWEGIKDVKVHDGQLSINPLRLHVPTASISNLDVLLTLLERLAGQARAQ